MIVAGTRALTLAGMEEEGGGKGDGLQAPFNEDGRGISSGVL